MVELSTTISQYWVQQYLCGIMFFHFLSGYDLNIVPKTEPTPETLVFVLQDIVEGKYEPSKYFKSSNAAQTSFVSEAPPLPPKNLFALIHLNASTARSQFVSVPDGGILYEDPIWAILAAHAISMNTSVAVPIAQGNQELWKNLPLLKKAVMEKTYKPQEFFGSINGFIPSGSSAKFGLLVVESDKIQALRERGVQSLMAQDGLRFFELFLTPTHK
jgi:hypothetical protein